MSTPLTCPSCGEALISRPGFHPFCPSWLAMEGGCLAPRRSRAPWGFSKERQRILACACDTGAVMVTRGAYTKAVIVAFDQNEADYITDYMQTHWGSVPYIIEALE